MSGARIEGVATALPPHFVDQETLIAAFRALWQTKHFNVDRLEDLHRSVQVGGRHLALPIDAYLSLTSFRQRNDAWIESATTLGEQVVRSLLEKTQCDPKEIDHLYFVSVTGLATPSIDARLMNRIGFRNDVKRVPIFGLGCVAGAAGLARAADAVTAFPKQNALLLSVELCSLTLQREDLSIPNIIASGLFGDGAAAVLVRGESSTSSSTPKRLGPRVVATRSVFYPDTERMMGWDFVDSGFKVILSAQVPQLVTDNIRANVDDFLKAHLLTRSDVRHWVAHTGGPKVLTAFETALELKPGALERSWKSLKHVGNLSSASVLFVLEDTLAAEDHAPQPGDYGVLMAMGPGFCAELVLLRW